MSQDQLYFIAIILPEPHYSAVRKFQEDAASLFDSRHALRSPPHITLVPPFRSSKLTVLRIKSVIEDVTAGYNNLEVVLQGFSSFDKRVIYVEVRPSESLARLASHLSHALRQEGMDIRVVSQQFHPHVTVAFRDLKELMFDKAFSHFRALGCAGSFITQTVSILRHSQAGWKELERIRMN